MVNNLKIEYKDQEENISKILGLISKIQEILYKFTNQKLRLYLSIPELSYLLKYYISQDLDPICDTEWYVQCKNTILNETDI